MTNVHRQRVGVEYQRGGGDQAVGAVDLSIGKVVQCLCADFGVSERRACQVIDRQLKELPIRPAD